MKFCFFIQGMIYSTRQQTEAPPSQNVIIYGPSIIVTTQHISYKLEGWGTSLLTTQHISYKLEGWSTSMLTTQHISYKLEGWGNSLLTCLYIIYNILGCLILKHISNPIRSYNSGVLYYEF